jgi:hypothetical protein
MSSFDRRKFLLAASSIGAVAAFSSRAFADPGVSADKILFGQAAVLEGPASALGIGMRDGLRGAFAECKGWHQGPQARADEPRRWLRAR